MRDRNLPTDGRDVHDPAVSSGPHVRQDGQRCAHRAPEDDRERSLEVGHLQLLSGGDLDDAGIVDEQIDSPESLEGGSDQPVEVVRLLHVANHGQHLSAQRLQPGLGPVELGPIARAQDDPTSVAGQLLRDQLAEPPGTAGHDRNLTGQPTAITPAPDCPNSG